MDNYSIEANLQHTINYFNWSHRNNDTDPNSFINYLHRVIRRVNQMEDGCGKQTNNSRMGTVKTSRLINNSDK